MLRTANRTGARAACWIQDGDAVQGVPEGPHQIRTFAVDDDVAGETLAVQVEGDKVVDLLHLTGGHLGSNLLVAGSAGYQLTPGLGRQGILWRSGLVPAGTLRRIVYPEGDVVRQGQGFLQPNSAFGGIVPGDAVAEGGVYVVVGVVLQQPPYAAVRIEGDCTFSPGHFQQPRDDGVAGDVAGDVFLGVVGAHLLLVDVLFEDVAQHVGIDFVVVASGPVV